MKNKLIYLTGLNGIRAIAAIAVVISHTILNLEKFGLENLLGLNTSGTPKTWNLAGYAVTMFFALSGFLITYLLLKEKEVAQINIQKFYARRILRIWPLYYLYFGICILIYFVFQIKFNNSSVLFYIFYAANVPFILGTTLPFLAHFWSLGVEEQFYLFWPWINKLKIKTVTVITLLLFTLLFGVKLYLHFCTPGSLIEIAIDVTRFHCMMIGGLAAIVYYSNISFLLRIATNKITQIVCWFCMLALTINKFHIASVIDNEIIAVVISVLIIGQITKTGLISLENKYFDFLGKISYGIYVIHPLLIILFSKVLYNVTTSPLLNYIIVFTTIVGSTILLSHLSYEYYESRFIKLKSKKYSVVKSKSTMH
jgi:peptidoglycan/LPS O-acetylase OafA/YrhL